MADLKKALILVAVLTVGGGCTATELASNAYSPTHQWARPDTTVAEYKLQNVRCAEAARMNLEGAPAGSSEFLAYRNCMEARGFELKSLVSANGES